MAPIDSGDAESRSCLQLCQAGFPREVIKHTQQVAVRIGGGELVPAAEIEPDQHRPGIAAGRAKGRIGQEDPAVQAIGIWK